jgi:hypothetical protein
MGIAQAFRAWTLSKVEERCLQAASTHDTYGESIFFSVNLIPRRSGVNAALLARTPPSFNENALRPSKKHRRLEAISTIFRL